MICIDFETYSELSIGLVGAYTYIAHDSFKIICLGYQIEDEPVKIWRAKDKVPPELTRALDYHSIAIYTPFELLVLNKCYKQFNLATPPEIERYVDIQAISANYGYPLDLGTTSKIMGVPKGPKILVKNNNPSDLLLESVYRYCIQDVKAEMNILNSLPKQNLSYLEQHIWIHTIKQNLRGVYIDKPLVINIVRILNEWKIGVIEELKEFTNGTITTGNQVKRMKDYILQKGISIGSLNAATVEALLSQEDLNEDIRKILTFRKLLSKTSTAKFQRILDSIADDNTVKMNLQYFGAITGRFGGRGLQIHNLPQRKESDPTKLISSFNTSLECVIKNHGEQVMELASKLIRPSIISPPGKDFLVSDYVSVENRVLHWCAGDTETLQEFEQGLDQYKTFASSVYNIPYNEVTSDQRFRGKTAILGLGYGMGHKTYLELAKGYGLKLTEEEATEITTFYRKKYKLVVKLWYKLYTAAQAAITYKGKIYEYNKVQFCVKEDRLYMKLPSGRKICYNKPLIEYEQLPWATVKVITFEGMNPYMHKWMRNTITKGRLTENLVQALSRDILVEGLLNIEQKGYEVIASVHDEIICYTKEGEGNIDEINSLACQMPKWANGLPLLATGYRAKRYRKE